MSKLDWNSFETEALKKLMNGEKLGGKDGVMAPLIKHLLETALGQELDIHLQEEKSSGIKNRKNGKVSKGVKTSYGQINLETSRDRNSSFEPILIGKRETTLGEGMDNKIISMYSRGMSYSDIQAHLEELYGLELSKGQVSSITDKVWKEIVEWQNRRLESCYPIIWMDALHFKVRVEGKIVSRAMYVVLGLNECGKKDLLGLYISESEGAKFWLQVLTDLQNRGVEDILIACIDNLKGFTQAIASIYPKTEVQLCVIHQIRNTMKYITSGDSSKFMKDLKKVYQASTKAIAEKNLEQLAADWGKKYPIVIKSWRHNWDDLSAYFQYAPPIRKMMYTTNTIEGFNRQIRKITKSKGVFPSEEGVVKLVWLVTKNITAMWKNPIAHWGLIIQQLALHFPQRLKMELATNQE